MRQILTVLGSVLTVGGSLGWTSVAQAEQSLHLTYPPKQHETTAEQIFLIGTAPPEGEVLVNGKPIPRSEAGHFAPSFPLKMGENQFTLRYRNQEVQIEVTRTSPEPKMPAGIGFAEDSLTPARDMARLPEELICFGAVAPPKATVSVELGTHTIPLSPQPQAVQLPPSSAALTGEIQPDSRSSVGQYKGCTTFSQPTNLGNPLFQLRKNGKTVSQQSSASVEILSPANLDVVEVTAEEGDARTGPSTSYSRLTPLPKGTTAAVTGREGEWLRLDYGAWIKEAETRLLANAIPPKSLIRSILSRQAEGATEVIFPLTTPVPVSVQQGDNTFTLTLHNTTAQTDTIRLDNDPLIKRLDWQQVTPTQVQYTFQLKSEQQWGYDLQYEGTSLIVSLRYPPEGGQRSRRAEEQGGMYTNGPLAGVEILLDPGHGGEELGSKGPTGYPEKDVNLVVSKLLEKELRRRGAIVYMTRERDKEVSLQQRVEMINLVKPAITLSIHYNALPDSGDAINTAGIGAFWYHPQAHNLAVFLQNYLVEKLDRPSYGVFWNNLALTRPHTAPAVLLELGFMINPTEFEWITNPQAQERLANTLADGITEWFQKKR